MIPKISVIMSTLNTDELYLNEAINSILSQTYRNFEFIIVVDGGKDFEFIKRNFGYDKRIKIIKHYEVKGLPYSLNESIMVAKGDYIARMDSDDISVKNRLEVQMKYMEMHKDVDMTSMYYKEIGEGNKHVLDIFIKPEEINAKLFYINNISHPCVMLRKSSIVNKKLFYNTSFLYSQDFELWTRDLNLKIKIIPKFGLKYRIHSKQISSEKRVSQDEYYFSILERNLERLHMDKVNLKYLLYLNGRKKIEDLRGLAIFVQNTIEKNDIIKIYDKKSLNKILNLSFSLACLKNRKIFNKYCFKNVHYLLWFLILKIKCYVRLFA